MCRFAAYAGPERPLADVLIDAPRSLSEQAFAPRQQIHGHVNVDGTGAAWWWPDDPEPVRYRTAHPPWADVNLPGLAARITATRFLAAVRGATPGVGLGPTFAHPFASGRLAGTHNGWIGAWRERTARPLIADLPDALFAELDGLSDSHVLFLHAVAAHGEGADLGDAALAACDRIAAECARAGTTATLNLLIGDGERFAATRLSAGDAPVNSLWALEDGAAWPDAVLLASEPLDDDRAWREIPAGTVAVAGPDGVTIRRTNGQERSA